MPIPAPVIALGSLRICRLPAEPTKLYITARGDSVTIATLADEPDAEAIAEAICGDWNAAADVYCELEREREWARTVRSAVEQLGPDAVKAVTDALSANSKL